MSRDDRSFKQLPFNLDQPVEYSLFNIPILFDRLPVSLFNSLVAEVDKIQKDDFKDSNHLSINQTLAGHVKREYSLNHCIESVNHYILGLATTYQEKYNLAGNVLTNSVPFKLSSLWVNFQKKYEFNPVHDHSGFISFVIWTKIPYNLEDESRLFVTNEEQTSRFGFIHQDIIGGVHVTPIPVDKNYEGVICMFPSRLNHFVNPFYTSDEYRISISGNILLDTSKY